MAYKWRVATEGSYDYISTHIPKEHGGVVRATRLDREDHTEFKTRFWGFVLKMDDGTFWTDVSATIDINMVQIGADTMKEAQAAALMLWRMEV